MKNKKYSKFIHKLYDKNWDSNQKFMTGLAALVGCVCLIIIQCTMLFNINKQNYEKLAINMLDSISLIVQENKNEKTERTKDYYRYAIEDIKDITSIIDLNNISYNDTKTFERFSNISTLTEFSIYDRNGIKIGGLKPEEYGTKLTDDKIKANFVAMLDGIKSDMIVDGSLDKDSKEKIIYAAAWNNDRNYILLVATNLTDEYYQEAFISFDMDRLISHMSATDDIDVIVINPDEDERICASTNKDYDDILLKEIGIDKVILDKNVTYTINGDEYYGYFKEIDGYKIGVVKDISIVNSDVLVSITITVVYLLVFFAVLRMLFSISMNIVIAQKRKELRLKSEVNNDSLTGLYNRRAYEKDVLSYNNKIVDDNLVVAAIDVNGLKKANDTLGHEAGDELIIASAKCLKAAFEPYGHVYRTGGDEFIAIILADESTLKEIDADLQDMCNNWRGNLINGISLSVGYAAEREFKYQSIIKLTKEADANMYMAKQEHYKKLREQNKSNSDIRLM